jgi:flagellar biosynthesis protein FlhA
MNLAGLRSSATLLFVLVVVLMLLIPLPTPVLSVLILANLALSLVVAAVATLTARPLDFSSFPSLLLLTTLLRLALNVSTARLILLQANAGSVIQAFGQFVMGDNPVVGVILFLLLFVVQYMVITRGAERVSEVAARFTLDAMPGKQMAIDADLHAGILNEEEARRRRREIAREADFYGAMDGAARFIRGDAVATLVVLLINVVGGLLVGVVQRHMALGQAVNTYALLSIGDAMSSQLPALLLSVSTGIVVTRSGQADGDLATVLGREMFFRPEPLYVVAGLLLLLGIATPIGLLPSLVLAAVLGYLGRRLSQARQAPLAPAAPAPPAPEEPRATLPDPVSVEFGFGLLPLADPARGGDLLARITGVRRRLAEELGFVLPPVRVRDNVALPAQTYVVRLRGTEVGRGELLPDRLLAMQLDAGAVPGMATRDPVFGLPALWIAPAQREAALRLRAVVVEPTAVLATHLTEVLRRHAAELFRREDARAFLERVRGEDAAAVEELSSQNVPLGTVHRVLQNLLREGVGIQDGVTICEALGDAAATTRDPDALTEAVRQALGRAITRRAAGEGRLAVVTLDPALEQEILSKVARGDRLGPVAVDSGLRERVAERVRRLLAPYVEQGRRGAVVTSPALRPHLRRLLERSLPDVPVLSYGELDPDAEMEVAGSVPAAESTG